MSGKNLSPNVIIISNFKRLYQIVFCQFYRGENEFLVRIYQLKFLLLNVLFVFFPFSSSIRLVTVLTISCSFNFPHHPELIIWSIGFPTLKSGGGDHDQEHFSFSLLFTCLPDLIEESPAIDACTSYFLASS